jgi:MerR family transcriptional regulator, redox-sensitive transcriptional activator SoxR
MKKAYLTVGEVAKRSGVPVSTLHFYERKGLIDAERNSANHRMFRREILRRVSIIKIAQSVGIPLSQIAAALRELPKDKNPSEADWARLAGGWHDNLSHRIELLTSLRDKMTMCIGCGCLSVKRCPLVNKDDHLAEKGEGAHLL